MTHYEPHPAALLFPMMEAGELQKLAEDIRENGLIEPVVIYEEKVLDGRNRLEACKLAGIEPRFDHANGNIGSPYVYVLCKNLHRRHLTASQRAAIAAETLPHLIEEAKLRQKTGTSAPIGAEVGKSRERAAAAAQVGTSSVDRAWAVKKADPEMFERIKAGEITANAAHQSLTNPAAIEKTNPPKTTTPHSQRKAAAQKRRMVDGLSVITGVCRGLQESDVEQIRAACDPEELSTWIERSKELAKQLRAFAVRLEGKNA